MKSIIILGCVGNCIDILDTINDINDRRGAPAYTVAGFLDDDPRQRGKTVAGAPVLGTLAEARQFPECWFVNGIYSASLCGRTAEIVARTGISTNRFETIVHPTASVSRMATLGAGVVIFQQVVVTSNVVIGDHVMILPGSVISHDDHIGSHCCLAGGVTVCGKVVVEEGCYLGAGSVLKDGIRVGRHSLIGMGGVVLRDVAPQSVMVGNPARLLRQTHS